MFSFAPIEIHSVGEWMEDHYRTIKTITVAATDEDGRRWVYQGPVKITTEDDAYELIRRIQRHQRETGAEINPEDKPRFWSEYQPVYGSREWLEHEQIMAEQEMMERGHRNL